MTGCLKVLDLFSGIGGFSLGLERTGFFETVAFCEIEPFCQKVLKKHWPDVPVYEDVREVNGSEYKGKIDVITGGYPCQPFSVAGQQKGEADDRHLWPEMYRIIKQARPTWVLAENVAGHIALGLDTVLADLEAEGYAATAVVIPACAVRANHRRDRVWIMANAKGERIQRLWTGGEQEPCTHGQAQLPVRESQGRNHTGWEVEPDVARVVNGVPRRVDRIRSLGNAVVPQIPERIGRAIVSLEPDYDWLL